MSSAVGIGDTVEHKRFGRGIVREVNPPRRPGSIPTVLVDGWTKPHGVTREYSRRGRGWLQKSDSHVNVTSVRVVRKAGS